MQLCMCVCKCVCVWVSSKSPRMPRIYKITYMHIFKRLGSLFGNLLLLLLLLQSEEKFCCQICQLSYFRQHKTPAISFNVAVHIIYIRIYTIYILYICVLVYFCGKLYENCINKQSKRLRLRAAGIKVYISSNFGVSEAFAILWRVWVNLISILKVFFIEKCLKSYAIVCPVKINFWV